MLEFKAKIILEPLGVMSSWNHSIHFCRWSRVTCGRRYQRVIVLDLQSSKLVGFISPHVGNLCFLKNITLQNNSFHNEIPPEIGHLRKLQFLQLQFIAIYLVAPTSKAFMSVTTFYLEKFLQYLASCQNSKFFLFTIIIWQEVSRFLSKTYRL